MSNSIKIQYVGNCSIDGSGIVTKEYSQIVSGSAWKKVGTDVILINLAGYSRIIVKYNMTHPYKDQMHNVLTYLKQTIPHLQIIEV